MKLEKYLDYVAAASISGIATTFALILLNTFFVYLSLIFLFAQTGNMYIFLNNMLLSSVIHPLMIILVVFSHDSLILRRLIGTFLLIVYYLVVLLLSVAGGALAQWLHRGQAGAIGGVSGLIATALLSGVDLLAIWLNFTLATNIPGDQLGILFITLILLVAAFFQPIARFLPLVFGGMYGSRLVLQKQGSQNQSTPQRGI